MGQFGLFGGVSVSASRLARRAAHQMPDPSQGRTSRQVDSLAPPDGFKSGLYLQLQTNTLDMNNVFARFLKWIWIWMWSIGRM